MNFVSTQTSLFYLVIVSGSAVFMFGYYQEFDWSIYTSYKTGKFELRTNFLQRSSIILNQTPRGKCGCPLEYNFGEGLQFKEETSSFCSDEASLKGKGQKVISFSLYHQNKTKTDILNRYFNGILQNLEHMRIVYPEWAMRLYAYMHPIWDSRMCAIICNNTDFYFCDVRTLPVLGDISGTYGRNWRFFVLGDPTVNTFISRDLDSTLQARERSAVDAWINSNYTFHAMRDHPLHRVKILAGMWGAKNFLLDRTYADMLRSLMLTKLRNMPRDADQTMLATKIYPKIRKDLLIHDSYSCLLHKDSIPFPVQRKDPSDFVGNFYYSPTTSAIMKPCPVQCRPSFGKNWTFC